MSTATSLISMPPATAWGSATTRWQSTALLVSDTVSAEEQEEDEQRRGGEEDEEKDDGASRTRWLSPKLQPRQRSSCQQGSDRTPQSVTPHS